MHYNENFPEFFRNFQKFPVQQLFLTFKSITVVTFTLHMQIPGWYYEKHNYCKLLLIEKFVISFMLAVLLIFVICYYCIVWWIAIENWKMITNICNLRLCMFIYFILLLFTSLIIIIITIIYCYFIDFNQ